MAVAKSIKIELKFFVTRKTSIGPLKLIEGWNRFSLQLEKLQEKRRKNSIKRLIIIWLCQQVRNRVRYQTKTIAI